MCLITFKYPCCASVLKPSFFLKTRFLIPIQNPNVTINRRHSMNCTTTNCRFLQHIDSGLWRRVGACLNHGLNGLHGLRTTRVLPVGDDLYHNLLDCDLQKLILFQNLSVSINLRRSNERIVSAIEIPNELSNYKLPILATYRFGFMAEGWRLSESRIKRITRIKNNPGVTGW